MSGVDIACLTAGLTTGEDLDLARTANAMSEVIKSLGFRQAFQVSNFFTQMRLDGSGEASILLSPERADPVNVDLLFMPCVHSAIEIDLPIDESRHEEGVRRGRSFDLMPRRCSRWVAAARMPFWILWNGSLWG